ncbi:AhpC-TSA-domain-containing protein [Paxillus ammoniavirescens]|nr:AhpC-TSA-domain-containing protein [Paxillus ammoniavirescens]
MTGASTEASAPAPRRSSRISAQPKPEQAPPAKTTKKAAASVKPTKAGTKRAAEVQEGGDGESSKKAKVPAEDEIQPAAEPEEKVDELAAESSSSDAPKKIDIGDTIPSVILKNEKGEDVDTSMLTEAKGVVLFLVPKADTPGCTTQACGFRDVWQEFGALDFDVYCLSADSPSAQTKWQTKKQLPYELLSDPKRTLIGALGAADGNKTKRSHFVFERGGTLVDKKMPVKPVDSPRLALEFIKGINK